MAIGGVEGDQGAEQLLVEVFAVGQQAEIQRLQGAILDHRRQGVVRRYGNINGFTACQHGSQLFSGAVGVVVDADAGFCLEVFQHLWGDVVVPVVDANHLFGAGQHGHQGK